MHNGKIIVLSSNLEKTLRNAFQLASLNQHEFVTLEHLLFALTEDKDALSVFNACGIDIFLLKQNLDLFISVSNSTAHLAGALGVKTLLIKPFNHATYHYWNQPSSNTPWYSSIKLINKKTLNQESNIIKKNLDKLD